MFYQLLDRLLSRPYVARGLVTQTACFQGGVVMSDIKSPPPSNITAQDDHRDLDELGEKLREVQAKRATRKSYDRPEGDEMPNSGLGVGLRIGTELLVGVMVGAAIGWSFDRALGTDPWGFLIFFVLGFVGGIMNVIRSANKAMANSGAEGDDPDAPND